MQRLLRGRILYVALGVLVTVLYAHALLTGQGSLRLAKEAEQAVPAAQRRPVEIFPQSIDAAAMQRLSKEKPLVAVVTLATSFITAFIVILGIAFSIWGILSGHLKSLWRFPHAALPAWTWQELSRILLLVLFISGFLPFARLALLSYEPRWEIDIHAWMPVSMTVLDAFVILAILVFAEGKRRAGAWEAMGFTLHSAGKSVRLALRSYVTLFPWLILLLYFVVQMANQIKFEPPPEPIQSLIFEEHRPWVFGVTVLLACVVGPLAEECFFRGVLYPTIRRSSSRWIAMLLSGGLFAAIHTNIIGFLPIMFLGCMLAYVYERSGSLAGSFVAHALHNSLLMGMALVYRYITPAS